MRLLWRSPFCSLSRSLTAPLCCFYFRSRGQQVHLIWAAPMAQRLLQLQKVLHVSGRTGFPDMQRRHPLPRLWQRFLSDLSKLEKHWQYSPNLTYVALLVSFIGFSHINLLECSLHVLMILCLIWEFGTKCSCISEI